ncbi:MAG: transcription antitermination factor NusB, partial [Gemmatimonadota bacterium]|nr:transcription antitermination factor NusB [Gemmatimonadota bacterium]
MNPRAAAHRILAAVRDGTFSDPAAERILPRVEPADRGLALELANGCLRLRARMDTWIEAFTDRPLARIDDDVLDWLRLGVYQLKELRVPDHAAVFETVRAARATMDAGRAGFVNGVLRAVASDPDRDPFPSRDEDPLAYLSTWGSHPEWLLRRWLDRWGVAAVMRLVRHANAPPPVVVRSFEDGDPAPDGQVELRRLSAWNGSFELVRGTPARALERVKGVIQDPAASAVVDYVGRDIADPVLDVCAAPGTKAAALAASTGRPVFAFDISPRRLRRTLRGAERAGRSIAVAAADARRPPVARAGTVLADVPCTGTGVLRRRADARWRLEEGRIADLVELQAEIMDACAGIVEEGGWLVYATCSLEPEENEDQVEAFLATHPDFGRDPLPELPVPESCITDDGDLFVRPWLTGTDGSYAARL